MVVIECPHCGKEIEMDDGAFGLFECPYCEGEYEWGEPPKKKIRSTTNSKRTTTKSKLQSRTRTTTTTSRINTTKQKATTRNKQSPSVVQFISLIGNFLLIFVLISGLNSGSWYSYSIVEEDDIQMEADFGLSSVTNTITYFERPTGDYENPDDTYEDVKGSVTHYESSVKYAEINKEIIDRECSDYEQYSYWGETEDEYDDRCRDMKSSAKENLDWWSGWESSSTILFFLLWLGIIVSTVILFLNGLKLMEQIGSANSEFSLNRDYAKIQSLGEMIFYTIMILGLFLYMLFIPSLELLFGRGDIPDDLSSGMGFIWWISVITLIGCLIISIVDSSKIKGRFQ